MMRFRHGFPVAVAGAALAPVFLMMAACGGAPANAIVSPRAIDSASGAPVIIAVTDLGDLGRLPESGPMPAADSDGVFVTGELILIRGRDFGKQPAVRVGRRPTPVIARTGSGGVIARIPPGVDAGAADVEISHPGGRHKAPIQVRRYGLVVALGAVHLITVDRRGTVTGAADLAIAGAQSGAISRGGQVALITADPAGPGEPARLVVVAMTASGGPKVVRELRLGAARAGVIAAATGAPMAALVIRDKGGGRPGPSSRDQVILVDLEDPRTPALHKPFTPGLTADSAASRPSDGSPSDGSTTARPTAGSITGLALAPDGRLLVVLTAGQNQLIPVDLRVPAAPVAGAAVELVPEARVPLLRAAAFSPGGDALWVVAGDSAEAVKTGVHPAQLIALAVGAASASGAGGLRVLGKADITAVAAPTALAVASRESAGSGAAVASRADRVPMAVAWVERGVFDPAQRSALQTPGHLARIDSEGNSAALAADPGVLLALAMSHDARFVFAAVRRSRGQAAGDGAAEIGVLAVALGDAESGEPAYITLGPVAAEPAATAAPATLSLAP